MTKTADLLRAPQLGGASALPTVHNDLTLRPVLNELPAWRAVVEQILELDKALSTQPRMGGVEENVAAVLIDELTAGRGIPDDIEARAAVIGSTVSARHAVRAGLTFAGRASSPGGAALRPMARQSGSHRSQPAKAQRAHALRADAAA